GGVPWALRAESRQLVAGPRLELAGIGIDSLAGAAAGQPRELAADPSQLRSTPSATFADLAAARGGSGDGFPPPDVVLDVRTNNEWKASHVKDAVHIPLYELKNRTTEIP